MLTPIEILERDFRVELARIRTTLEASAAFVVVSPRLSDPPLPAAWILHTGELSPAPVDETSRPATCGAVVDMLECSVHDFAAREYGTMEWYVNRMVHADERAGVLERAAPCWPWSKTALHGELFWRLRDLALYRAGLHDLRLRSRKLDGISSPEAVDSIDWMREHIAREQLKPGEVLEGYQVACLYMALPESIRHVRAVRPRFAAIGRGDEQRYLLEGIAPAAIKREKSEKSHLDATDAVSQLADATRRSIGSFRSPLLEGSYPQTAADADNWALELKRAFADHLARTGPRGKTLGAQADKVEDPWPLWLRRVKAYEPFLFALARALWTDKVNRPTSQFELSTAQVGDDRYSTLPKTASAVSWAFGGAGKTTPVKVDDDTYATTPSVASKLLPRSWPLLTDKGIEKRPHQAVLAFESPASESLPVAVVGATNYAITPLAAKVAVLALANENVKRGKMQSISLGELARLVNPNAKRIQDRELQAASAALDELRRLFVYLPDGGKVQLFDTKSAINPSMATADLQVLVGLASGFVHTLDSGIVGGSLSGNEYRGEFLINLDAMMRIPAKRPSLMRHSIRAYAHWNAAFKPGSDGEFDPSMMPTFSAEQWAAITNSIPPGVVEYLLANDPQHRSDTRRVQWGRDRKAMQEDLAELEAAGIIVVEQHGKDRFKLLPPKAYLEAWRLSRKQGKRPADDVEK
jgi:hypothetical protein